MYPDDLKYTPMHEWVRTPGDTEGSVRVGIATVARADWFRTTRSRVASALSVARSFPLPAALPCHSYVRVASR